MNICIFFIFLSWLHEDKQQFSMKNICPRELQDSLDWNIFAIEVQTLNVGVVICKMAQPYLDHEVVTRYK